MALNYHAVAIGRAVAAVIREAGLTHKATAELVGMTERTMIRRINGEGDGFYWSEVEKIAAALDIPLLEVCDRAKRIYERRAA